MRLRRNRVFLAIIIVMVGLAGAALTVRTFDIAGFERGSEEGPLGLRLGLDLQGGTHLVYRAENPNVTSEQMDGLVDVIQRRINAFGVSEPLIQKKGNNEIVIQLPGIRDIDEAKQLIGGTAQLDFRQCIDLNAPTRAACPGWEPATAEGSGGVVKHLTGEFMRPNSFVLPDPGSGLPVVSFEFNREGSRMFEQITRRLIQRPLGIFLDDQLVSAPTVQSVISSQGRITGLSRSEGERLSIQLNAGALPVSIKVVREQDVSATLGEDSLQKSYIAAVIGLGLIMLFMIAFYRMLGGVAALSLVFYTVMVLAIFKLAEVTLTLSGIAAFVISVGMAVDANVIIFERLREELRAGRSLSAAIETGFDRAWAAIRDGNITTLLVMVILWWFGDQLGEPRVTGFAITMIIAVSTSMFTAFFVSRTFLRLLVGTPIARRLHLFADMKGQESPGRPALGL
ncbi:MAG: protein translocase subunit SecD [Dehalococcoidia bacterium]